MPQRLKARVQRWPLGLSEIKNHQDEAPLLHETSENCNKKKRKLLKTKKTSRMNQQSQKQGSSQA